MITSHIAEQVREAASRGQALRITGAGTWLDAGGRVQREPVPLPLADLTGVVEYTPGDLTLTARAGTTLAEIARVTGAERQWLALDPHGSDEGTIGATIATASWGPLAHAFGSPRDTVLGLEAVTGEGTIIRSGGRVVKNVAGFDITRLLTGAWGTLGVITEVSVRLRAMPECEETIAIAARDDSAAALTNLFARVRAAAAAPWALELVSPALAATLGVAVHTVLLARIGGNETSVRAQRAALAAVGSTTTVPDSVWAALRGCEPRGAAVERASLEPSSLPDLWQMVREAFAHSSGAFAHANVGRGVVRYVLPSSDSARMLWLFHGGAGAGSGCTCIPERRPEGLDDWNPRGDDMLSRRARDAFDPKRILNCGIMGVEK